MPTKPTVQKGVKKAVPKVVARKPVPKKATAHMKADVVPAFIAGEPPVARPVRKAIGEAGRGKRHVPAISPRASKSRPASKAGKIPQPPPLRGADTGKGILERSIVGRYFFLPTDFLVLAWRGMKFAFRNWWRVAIVASVAIVGHYAFGAGVEGIAFLGFLAAVFAWNLDGRVSIGAGLSCLVLIVVMQALIQSGVLLLFETSTETVAVWAYYFLVIGVAKQLVDLVREGRGKKRITNG